MFINVSKNNPVWVNINKIITVEYDYIKTKVFFDDLNYSYTEYSVEEIMKMIEEKLAQKPN